MYEIALSVQACVHAGTHVDVAWLVRSDGADVDGGTDALALTPGGGRTGGLLGGVLDDQVADMVAAGQQRRLVELVVGPVEALVGGLPEGLRVSAVVVPADVLPVDLWESLRRREPVGLAVHLDGGVVTGADVVPVAGAAAAGEDAAALFERATFGSLVDEDRVLTVFWPVPRLVVVGRGPVPEALGAAAALLGWQVRTVTDVSSARGLVAGLAGLDRVVVAAHDVEVAGPALAAALESGAGYIGSVGSRRMQSARGDWLAYRGVTDLTRVHGPAGLDIGATTPAEIAVSILAEAVAVGTGSAVARRDEPT